MNIVQNLLSAISPLPDGDLSDRLNYCYTTTILIICSAFVSGWSFIGQPIQCWFPAYYRGWWMEYALDYCFVQNTYFVQFADMKPDNYFDIAEHIIPIPSNWTEREHKQIGYYQWVPFILALQALTFFLPVVIWRSIYGSTNMKVRAICETCSIKSNLEPGERSKNMEIIARFLICNHDVTKGVGGRLQTMAAGRVVQIAYISTKLLYAFNALMQFMLVKWMLGAPDPFWGWNVISDIIAGREWPETGNFPRVTLCDFSFNEKIFVFLWFWFCFIALFSIISLFHWLYRLYCIGSNYRLINSYLQQIDPISHRGLARRIQINGFIENALRPDGLLIIRLISINSGDLITSRLIATLWQDYQQRLHEVDPLIPEEENFNEPDSLLGIRNKNGKKS